MHLVGATLHTKDANHVAPLVASSTSYSLNRPLRFVNPTFLASITIFCDFSLSGIFLKSLLTKTANSNTNTAKTSLSSLWLSLGN